MKIDTRIAVVVFIFYFLNGFVSLGSSQTFLPPLFMEAYLLGGVALVYFILSIRSPFSVLFLLLALTFTVEPLKQNTAPTALQWWVMLVHLVLPIVLYLVVGIKLKTEIVATRFIWIFHFICFFVSLAPVFFENTAIVSLSAGLIQSMTGIILLSQEKSNLILVPWIKRMVLIMILLVCFDIAEYLCYISLPV